ncbi:hypothetical protein ACVGOW_01305 [Pseudonocardia saturnea]
MIAQNATTARRSDRLHVVAVRPRLHIIVDLLDDYPGIEALVIASRLGEIMRCTAIERNAGRDVPIGIRRAVRHLADAVRVEMQPPSWPRAGRRAPIDSCW